MAHYVDEYTDHLEGAPQRQHWPLALLLGLGIEIIFACLGLIFLVVGMVFAS